MRDQNEVKDMSRDEWARYYKESLEKGNIYMYNGVSKHTPIVYGTEIRRLGLSDGKWGIGMSAIVPDCDAARPVMVGKDTFERLMKALGVPEDTLKDFFEKEFTKEEKENF